MWEDSEYLWVVFCRNWWFHVRENILYSRRIPLAETDAVASLPPQHDHFMVRCGKCGKEYRYEPCVSLQTTTARLIHAPSSY